MVHYRTTLYKTLQYTTPLGSYCRLCTTNIRVCVNSHTSRTEQSVQNNTVHQNSVLYCSLCYITKQHCTKHHNTVHLLKLLLTVHHQHSGQVSAIITLPYSTTLYTKQSKARQYNTRYFSTTEYSSNNTSQHTTVQHRRV